MRLTFKNSRGEEREIADVANKEQAMQEINKFCSDRNYTIYYVRNWEKDNVVYYDVGSWSEFFHLYLEEVTMSNKEEIVLDESRAMVYIPDNSVEAELSFKVFVDGEIKSICKKMNMKELQEAITDAENNYIGEDDTFVITEEGKRWLESLQK